MTQEHINEVIAYIKREQQGLTKEKALKTLQSAGILDSNGEHTAPYRNLGKWVDEQRKAAQLE